MRWSLLGNYHLWKMAIMTGLGGLSSLTLKGFGIGLLVTGGVPGFTCLGRGAAGGERGVNFAGQGHLKGV
jgi:hypothetical protein